MSARRSTPYNSPNTLLGILGRWYPLLVPLLIILIGPEIGAIWTGFNAALGRPTIPYVYTPADLWHWFGLMSVSNTSGNPAEGAVNVWLALMVVALIFVIVQMFIDFLHGRNWGPMNYVLIALSSWSDLSRIMEGFPPSLTWWGPGGSATVRVSGDGGPRAKGFAQTLPRAPARARAPQRSEVRAFGGTFFGALWDLRRFLVAICLLAFGSYQLYLAIAFRQEKQITYADFVKTLPSSGWYRVTGVPLDYGFAVPHHDQKGVYGRYIPAVVAGSGGISLLVFADDTAEPTKGKVTKTKDVDGIVETLFESSNSVEADLKPYGPALSKSYRIIDEGETPHVLLGLVFGFAGIVIGLLLVLAGIGSFLERRENGPNESESSTT